MRSQWRFGWWGTFLLWPLLVLTDMLIQGSWGAWVAFRDSVPTFFELWAERPWRSPLR